MSKEDYREGGQWVERTGWKVESGMWWDSGDKVWVLGSHSGHFNMFFFICT